ncbi:hypothetical protein HK407_12g16970 [Ordospora pajunii]|uniref:uncharacterized protein n=1 Tax=Ordospora pajunii TaxID=3039483 RepID=UPI00295268BD|nr:uncharacterized protein HK407_12g16970 [Ordospora pajunii]KAH9410566.1 hypothetical protein HK407_12g16970 [Ordospora pajunii]
MRAKHLQEQDVFGRYFVLPSVPYLPKPRRKGMARISGVCEIISRLKTFEAENGVIVQGTATECELRAAFEKYGPILQVRVLRRYAFVVFEKHVDISLVFGKYHSIGNRRMYADRIKQYDADFMPVMYRNRVNLWHNHINKFE